MKGGQIGYYGGPGSILAMKLMRGGLGGGVDEAALISMVIAAESFWRFEVVAMVEDDSWEARRATMLLPRLPPREPFGGVMVEMGQSNQKLNRQHVCSESTREVEIL